MEVEARRKSLCMHSEKIPNYHKLIKIQWEKTKAAIDGKVLVKNVISEVKQSNGTPWSIKVLSSLVKDDGCIIDAITGKCNRPHCGFNYKVKLTDPETETLCVIIKEGTKVIIN